MTKSLTKIEVIQLFESLPKKHYKKAGHFIFRPADEDETILTIVSGKLETIKIAQSSEVVIRNFIVGSSAETYIISEETFHKRYDVPGINRTHKIDGIMWNECFAKGEIYAAEYNDIQVTFMAPWNEEMIMLPGDFLASPVGGDVNDIYRIEAETFFKTYNEV